MQALQTCLWFDHQAEDAAKFYTSLFAHSKMEKPVPYGKAGAQISGQPEGSVMSVEFTLENQKMMGLNGGPIFTMNPSLSFMVRCQSEKEIDYLWSRLAQVTRMELSQYPFAPKYGWCTDQFGVNWQLILEPGTNAQKICNALLFTDANFGRAEEAINFYVSQFSRSEVVELARDEQSGKVMYSRIKLNNQDFVLMDGPGVHGFAFTPGTSLIINCDSQDELDLMWSKLSADPRAEQCGWLKDKFGLSWQVTHKDWEKWIAEASPEKRELMMAAILKMKKPIIKVLYEIYKLAD